MFSANSPNFICKKCEKLARSKKSIYLCAIMSTAIIILLVILCLALLVGGIVGTFVPALPGPPLCWAAMLISYWFFPPFISGIMLCVMLGLTVVAQVLDYMAPVWMTKAGGGSKAATTGSTVGVLIGLFFMPLGLIVGPIVGAFVGEMTSSQKVGRALWIAILSFVSFLLTTGLKFVLCLLMSFYVGMAIWQYLT